MINRLPDLAKTSQPIDVGFRSSVRFLERFDGGLSPAAQFLAAAAVVLIGTLIAALLSQVFDLSRLAVFFLGSVIVCALFFGRRPAVFAAFLAFIAYNFSLVEPRFSVQFAGADDALTLAVFLVVALLVGGLAGRVRESERSSRRRADILETLLTASRVFSGVGDAGALRAELAAQLRSVTDSEAFVLPIGAGDCEDADEAAFVLAREAGAVGHLIVRGSWRARPLSDERAFGIAVWCTGDVSAVELGAQDRLCGLLIDFAAAALDRIKLVDLQTEVEAGVKAGRLRDAILGSISHDLRTPLATVLASASSLRDYGSRFDDATRQDLAEVIVQEADRLNAYVENLLALSRIEAGHLAPSLRPVALIEVVDAAIRRLNAIAGDEIQTECLDQALEVEADATLLEQVIFNLLDNALVHGGPSVVIDVRAGSVEGSVELAIEDNGIGVAEGELVHLCDKFYRGRNRSSDTRGTGIGLSIAKGFVEAMGGSLRLGPSQFSPRGLRVAITLAAAREEPS